MTQCWMPRCDAEADGMFCGPHHRAATNLDKIRAHIRWENNIHPRLVQFARKQDAERRAAE